MVIINNCCQICNFMVACCHCCFPDNTRIHLTIRQEKVNINDTIDFIACLANHIPNKCEQMVRYNGYCSNVCRGRRKKDSIDRSDFVLQDDEHTKGANKAWAYLIKKIYEVDPLILSQVWRQYEDYCIYRGL